jgi:ABC-type multidrug transport system ATPase subunit
LLNVLNQRNVSKLSVEGTLLVNGLRIGDAAAMAAVSGYVQQDDLFIGTLTPAEHLWFNAMLRMDRHVTTKVREQRIEKVVREVSC